MIYSDKTGYCMKVVLGTSTTHVGPPPPGGLCCIFFEYSKRVSPELQNYVSTGCFISQSHHSLSSLKSMDMSFILWFCTGPLVVFIWTYLCLKLCVFDKCNDYYGLFIFIPSSSMNSISLRMHHFACYPFLFRYHFCVLSYFLDRYKDYLKLSFSTHTIIVFIKEHVMIM